jgi:N-terminal acetyltransferase B complex non-catalytic subunit
MDLFTDKVQTLLDPIADSASTISARLWLNQNIESVPAKLTARNARIQSGVEPQHSLEDFRFIVYHKMGAMIVTAEDKDDDLYRLTGDLNELTNTLSKLDTFAPASQGVLLSLYTTYELGITVLKFSAYLARIGLPAPESFSFNEEIKSYGDRLVHAVIEKSSTIKKSLDEGGWIDKVLESVQGDPDVADTTSVAGTLRSVVDENFMEQWAGEVVDSWKDSVKGFAYFKPWDY